MVLHIETRGLELVEVLPRERHEGLHTTSPRGHDLAPRIDDTLATSRQGRPLQECGENLWATRHTREPEEHDAVAAECRGIFRLADLHCSEEFTLQWCMKSCSGAFVAR